MTFDEIVSEVTSKLECIPFDLLSENPSTSPTGRKYEVIRGQDVAEWRRAFVAQARGKKKVFWRVEPELDESTGRVYSRQDFD